MLTQTSELALRALLVLGLDGDDHPASPRQLATRLECSPSYLAKTLGILAKAGILRSVRGAHGGVVLGRSPEEITLLSVVEACQGLVIGNYCRSIAGHPQAVCAFHEVMTKVHEDTVATLSRWTLADLIRRPAGAAAQERSDPCRMAFSGCEAFVPRGNVRAGRPERRP